jgi:sugar/nucleoside kinase (ribokinase family)
LAGGRHYTAGPIEVDATDTTRAGNSFNAGLLHLLLRVVPLEDCLQCGSICGGLGPSRFRLRAHCALKKPACFREPSSANEKAAEIHSHTLMVGLSQSDRLTEVSHAF